MQESRFRKELTSVPVVQIRIGKEGLVTTIGGNGRDALQQIGDPGLSGPLPTDPFLIPGTRRDFGGGDLSMMTSPGLASFKALLSETRRREREIRADIRKAKLQLSIAWSGRALGWLSLTSLIAKPIRKKASTALAVRRSDVETLKGNLAATQVSVNFDLESEVAEPHRRMQEAFNRMASSQRVWSVITTQRIDRVKARSWAGTVVSHAPAVLRRLAASLVDTQDPPLAMPVLRGKSTAHFYPGFVLVDDGRGKDFALIDLIETGVHWGTMDFTESAAAAPSDAALIGKTWAKANKNGSRDRRFAHNRELPIMRYGLLHLSAAGGMDEAFMLSDAKASADFAAAVEELKSILIRGRGAQRLGDSQMALNSPSDRVLKACPQCRAILRLPRGRSGPVRCPECKSRVSITT